MANIERAKAMAEDSDPPTFTERVRKVARSGYDTTKQVLDQAAQGGDDEFWGGGLDDASRFESGDDLFADNNRRGDLFERETIGEDSDMFESTAVGDDDVIEKTDVGGDNDLL